MTNARSITPSQLRVLLFIIGFRKRHRYSPTLREISKSLGFSGGPAAVAGQIKVLKRNGYIQSDKLKPRTIVPSYTFIPAKRAGGH